jgi:hypothetical protein
MDHLRHPESIDQVKKASPNFIFFLGEDWVRKHEGRIMVDKREQISRISISGYVVKIFQIDYQSLETPR